ncbi:16964_t:CDS:2 [Rhizophagus irregularis]|nr:16964_t:CDS:2 [Rhizophagus irregularis]
MLFRKDEDNDGVSKSKLSGRLPPHPVKPDKQYHKKEGINSVEDKSDMSSYIQED